MGKPITIADKMRVKAALDPEQMPETVACLDAYMEEEIPPYDFATALVQCDKTAPMPKVLAELLVRLYKEAIAQENADAMNDLGALYYEGRGVEQDYTKAVYYYHMAAQHGSRVAQENLGYCYYYGRNVPVDYEKAFHYFALGAFAGQLISLYKIGDMYQNGYYVEKNPTEAFRIYERCIEQMTDEAAPLVAGPVFLRLGNALLCGEGTKQDAKGALICYQKAELFLHDMVANGEFMYKKSLQAAIDGQAKARAVLMQNL